MENDSYKTIKKPSEEILFKDRNSKFYSYAFPVNNEDEVKQYLDEVKKKHPSAGHYCYAYQLGFDSVKYRVNDDGEPNNSAGMPIYGQIQSFNLTNVLVVSVRYFGGIKLGVGGLINAYRTSAKLAIEASEIIEKIIEVAFRLNFEYDSLNKVMRIVREQNLKLIRQQMEITCSFTVTTRRDKAEEVYQLLKRQHKIQVNIL